MNRIRICTSISLIATISFTAALTGCQYKAEQSFPGPGASCDTTHITYANSIAAIISNNSCLACHSAAAPLAGFSLATYSDVQLVATNGQLYGALFHLPGFPPMPQGGAQLTACELSKVKAWIDAGAPEN